MIGGCGDDLHNLIAYVHDRVHIAASLGEERARLSSADITHKLSLAADLVHVLLCESGVKVFQSLDSLCESFKRTTPLFAS